jgi:hypothetical protein
MRSWRIGLRRRVPDEGTLMSDDERIGRDEFLKRATVGGGLLWVTPRLAPSRQALTDQKPCGQLKCKPGPKGDRKCGRHGCAQCDSAGFCGSCHTPCTHQGQQCDVLEPCGNPPNGRDCSCFQQPSGTSACVDIGSDRFCSAYEPCGPAPGYRCPPGLACILSCCPKPLCLPCCPSTAGRPRSRSRGGPQLTK